MGGPRGTPLTTWMQLSMRPNCLWSLGTGNEQGTNSECSQRWKQGRDKAQTMETPDLPTSPWSVVTRLNILPHRPHSAKEGLTAVSLRFEFDFKEIDLFYLSLFFTSNYTLIKFSKGNDCLFISARHQLSIKYKKQLMHF